MRGVNDEKWQVKSGDAYQILDPCSPVSGSIAILLSRTGTAILLRRLTSVKEYFFALAVGFNG
jgi:hypothetical protein